MALAQQGIVRLSGGTSIHVVIFASISFVVAALLVAGLWTPIAGVLVTLIQVWNGYPGAGDLWLYVRLGALGVALVLLGPGAWSVDAWLFGWKRIEIRDRKN